MTTIRIPPEALGDLLAWPLLARYGITSPFRLQVLANGDVQVSDEPLREAEGRSSLSVGTRQP